MNQQKNFREKEQQKNKGSLTLEASIVLVFFLVAYMAILSVINMYRGQVLIQNAANQTAQEIAQYTYLLKKAGLSEFGKQASDNATKFTDDTNKLVGTVFAFFEATSEGLDAGKEIANDMQTQTFPEDIFQLSSQLEDMQENADTIEKQADNIYSEYRTMMDAGSEYFSDPAAIFNGMLAILKDTTCDSIKIAVATPITKSLMNKYLAAYPADHLENLGVVGGNDGISYWGSSILLDMQSVEVCAYYKMKIDLPFLDLFEYQLKTTSSTRAWIGDGTHNDAKSASGETSKTDGASKTGRGVELDEQATGLPGFGGSSNSGVIAGGAVVDDTEESNWTSMSVKNKTSKEVLDALAYIGYTEDEFRELIAKPFDEYTNEEWAYMQAARAMIAQPDADTKMLKVITAETLEGYINKDWKTVIGCVTTTSAMDGNMGSYDDARTNLRLDYTTQDGEPFPEGGSEYFYITFNIDESQMGNLDIPCVTELGGNMAREEVSDPQSGNGFLKTEEANQPIIPEWSIDWESPVTVQEGATIWQVVDGKQREYAVFTEGEFILVNN